MDTQALEQQFKDLFQQAAADMGTTLKDDGKELGQYSVQRAQELAKLVNQPGFAKAVQAEADNVLLFAGISSVTTGDAVDIKLQAMAQGALQIAAGVLATSLA